MLIFFQIKPCEEIPITWNDFYVDGLPITTIMWMISLPCVDKISTTHCYILFRVADIASRMLFQCTECSSHVETLWRHPDHGGQWHGLEPGALCGPRDLKIVIDIIIRSFTYWSLWRDTDYMNGFYVDGLPIATIIWMISLPCVDKISTTHCYILFRVSDIVSKMPFQCTKCSS